MLDTVSIFLNLLRFDLWPKMWSILENVPCALKKVYSTFGWNVLKISMRSISSKASFKTCVSLLIFYFDDLSIGASGVLKSPIIIVLLSVSPFMSVSVCLMYWAAPLVGAYIFTIVMSSSWIDPLINYVLSFLISCNLLYFKVYFVWYEDCYSSFLLLCICIGYIFPSSHFQSIYVFRSDVTFL